MTTACRFSAGCCCFKNIFSLFFHIVLFFPLLFFVVFSLLCRGSGAAFFRRQGKTGFCRVGFLLCLYCFRLILLPFFFSFPFPFLFVVSPLLCRGFGAAFFHRQGKTGFCRVGFLLCLYCFRLILLPFFFSFPFPFLFVVSPLLCRGFGAAFFRRQGKTGFCRVGFLLCLYCFRLILLSFFLSLSLSLPLSLSLCRFPFVVPGFWSGVFPPAGEDRLLPCWFFIVFVLFLIDFVVFFLSLSLSLCRFPFVVPGFWSGVFPPAGEDRLLPCWFFIVFVLFPIDFCCLFFFLFCCFFFVFTWNVEINSKRNCEEREKVNF